ncbi:MAG: hydantoinase B/oxoprolinase family protein [Acidimicrobiia bacterium]
MDTNAQGVDISMMSIEEKLRRFGGPLQAPSPGLDPEVLNRPVLEEATDLEKRGFERLDDVDVEIFFHKLDSIVDEGRLVFINLSAAELLQAGDLGVSIFTAQGDLAAMSAGVIIHNLLHYGPIKFVLKHYQNDPTVGINDGDFFFFNEPDAGGVHTYDHFLTMPVFAGNELLAWVGCGGHQGESGSKEPGGFSADARHRYEEGIHVPPLKVGEGFEFKRDHLDFLLNSVRTPRQMGLDLKARLAVCLRLRDRLLRETERRGSDFVAAGMRAGIEQGKAQARERLAGLLDGTYRSVAFLDTIGVDEGLIRIPVALHKRGEELIIDLSGASPAPGVGPFHLRWHLARSAAAAALFPSIFRGLRWSIGMFDPIKVIAPPSIVNATERNVATGSGSHTGRVVVQALSMAIARAMFASKYREGVAAPFAENLLLLQFGGRDQYGFPLAGGPANGNATGQGARYDQDGEHSVGFFWAMVVDCPGPEEQEKKFPWLYLFRNQLDVNVHGFGRYRGGVGLTDCFVIHGVDKVTLSSVGTGGRFTKNYGLFGGYSGSANPRITIRGSNVKEMLARSDETIPVGVRELVDRRAIDGLYEFRSPESRSERYGPDDIIVLSRGSGGGYGDVLEREPAAVLADLESGLIMRDVAERIYAVVIDETGNADQEATIKARAQARQERLALGKTWNEFMSEWTQRRPPERALKYYGPWPVPAQIHFESDLR